jgi:hypothetical protein
MNSAMRMAQACMNGVDWKKKYICEKVMPCLHVALRKIIENNSACRTLY